MTKIEKREVEMARKFAAMGNAETAARILSAAIRSSLSGKSQKEILIVAKEISVDKNKEFIV